MWIAVKAVDEDDVDKPPADGSIDLCEAKTTDLWSDRGCLEKVSTNGRWDGHTWQTENGNLPSSPCKQAVMLKS